MTLQENQLWRFFTSVQLALIIIASLAITSIIGTIIPQGESINFYLERYGARSTVFFEILALNEMYGSFWFRTLLFLFCLNLIACSINRLPSIPKIINKDNWDINFASLTQAKENSQFISDQSSTHVINELKNALKLKVLDIKELKAGTRFLVFFEKHAWSRYGAYIVHLSILVIFFGGVVGSLFGFKAFVMVPEGESTSIAYSQEGSREALPLGFEVFCETFAIEYYKNGTPKEYKSDLSVLEQGQEIKKKRITVNNPLTHRGITFYQSSYQQIPGEYSLYLSLNQSVSTGSQSSINKTFSTKIKKLNQWGEVKAEFRIVAASKDGHGHGPYEIWFDDQDDNPITFVVNDNQTVEVKRESGTYSFAMKQRFATGLQVAKDPGVWLVYIGCTLMLLGLYVSFFMSHRKVWIAVDQTKEGTLVTIKGKTNKNKDGLMRYQNKIESTLIDLEMKPVRRA